MAKNNTLIVPKPVSAGLLLSYKCSSTCKHCIYSCNPKWSADWISEDDITSYLSQLSATIESGPYGPDNVELNSGLHITGGEPFVNFQLLLKATEIAGELGIPSTFVETNCYWCKNEQVTEDKLKQLKEAGLKGIMLSVNPFILEYVPFERTETAVRAGRKIFGQNAFVYQGFYYNQFRQLGIESTLTLNDYFQKVGLEIFNYGEIIPMGRFPYKFTHLYRKYKAQYFFSQSCKQRLTSPYHIHIDNYGNYIAGFCAGITLGDARDLSSIFEGIDLNARPVLKALVSSIEKLYRLGQDFGYEELPDGYISACHLCMDIRKHIAGKTDDFTELQPKQIYTQI